MVCHDPRSWCLYVRDEDTIRIVSVDSLQELVWVSLWCCRCWVLAFFQK